MDGWITKDFDGTRRAHTKEPEQRGTGREWGVRYTSLAIMPLVPKSEWDSIGPGECKRLTLPEAFDPDGPVGVGDYVQSPAGGPGVVENECNTIIRFREPNGVLHQAVCVDLTILAKAPKPAPEPEPVKCRYCGAGPWPQQPHTIGATRYAWWQMYCSECGQKAPSRATEAGAVQEWNEQNT